MSNSKKSISEELNLKSFPFVKVIAAVLLIIGAILAYFLASQPETRLFQIGGVNLSLVYGIPPLISGVVLLIYAFSTYYNVTILDKGKSLEIQSRQTETTIHKDDIKQVKVSNAGKGFIWFVFFFINFFFVYYGLECGIFFTANHNAGLLEYILIPLLLIWLAGALLVLFPRKLITILTKDRAILQKVNYIRKNRAFETFWDRIFGWSEKEKGDYVKTNRYLYRLILGVLFLLIFTISNLLVKNEGIHRPLHDLGIFIPVFLLLFAVLMIATSISTGIKQSFQIKDNRLKFEEKTIISSLTGRNYLWAKASAELDPRKHLNLSFRSLTKYEYLLIFVLFGQAFFLASKFIWQPAVYLKYINIWDMIIGILILVALFFYEFEIVTKLNVEIDTQFEETRDVIISRRTIEEGKPRGAGLFDSLKIMFKNYKNNFKSLIHTEFWSRIGKVALVYILAIVVITLTFSFMGFIFFLFI
ncbi:MAG: hypothetical protein ACOC44_06750 [Promethearchaeia archaeon]